MGAEQDFTAYASTRAGGLRDTAYLLCGDWHHAHDLTQSALIKLYLAWRRIERSENVDAYARKVLLREFLDGRRLRRSGERPVAALPDHPIPAAEPELRLTLLDALRRLDPRRRAVLVLRYWEDHSVETVAEIMRLTPGAVKALTNRAITELRTLLGPELPLLLHDAARTE